MTKKRVFEFRDGDMYLGGERLEYLGHGASRMTFVSPSGHFVYKFPREILPNRAGRRNGKIDNHIEAEVSSRWLRQVGLDGRCAARCKLIPGTDILVMEFVRATGMPAWDNDPRPHWMRTLFEDAGNQGGRNRRGRWVVYDYSFGNDARRFLEHFITDVPRSMEVAA